MKFNLLLFATVMLVWNCSALRERSTRLKNQKKYHRSLSVSNMPQKSCNSKVFKVNRVSHARHNMSIIRVLAENNLCSFYFEFKKNEEGHAFEVVETKFVGNTASWVSQKKVKVKINDIGWGSNLRWKIISLKREYMFSMYMKGKTIEDPFLEPKLRR